MYVYTYIYINIRKKKYLNSKFILECVYLLEKKITYDTYRLPISSINLEFNQQRLIKFSSRSPFSRYKRNEPKMFIIIKGLTHVFPKL